MAVILDLFTFKAMPPSLDSHKTNVVFEDGGEPSGSVEFDWESLPVKKSSPRRNAKYPSYMLCGLRCQI